MISVESQFKAFVHSAGRDLPLPGGGDTWRRFTSLAEQASIDLSLGRLCEGHADALAILDEAGKKPVDGAAYGVWASRSKGVADGRRARVTRLDLAWDQGVLLGHWHR